MKSRLGHFSIALIGVNLPVPFPWTTLLVSPNLESGCLGPVPDSCYAGAGEAAAAEAAPEAAHLPGGCRADGVCGGRGAN